MPLGPQSLCVLQEWQESSLPQIGVVGVSEQSPLDRHWTHWPVEALHFGVDEDRAAHAESSPAWQARHV
jgi:hypothetical protein